MLIRATLVALFLGRTVAEDVHPSHRKGMHVHARKVHHLKHEPRRHSQDSSKYKEDCWKRVPAWRHMSTTQRESGVAFLSEWTSRHGGKPGKGDKGDKESGPPGSNGARPGAGIVQDDIVPFETVQRDGFFEIGCYKEYLYNYGDKFGNNKDQYEYEEMGNSSIVNYNDIVPSEDREDMTHEVCFRFCRTVPGMYNFGIVNGNECYCAPFVKKIASDDSDCDAPCEGDPDVLCGSKSKSIIFEMHWCGTTGEKLFEAGDLALATERFIDASEMDIGEAGADKLQQAGAHLQEMFGTAGDVDADALMQKVKVYAGKISKALTKASKTKEKLADAAAKVDEFKDKEFASSETITKAEDLTKELKKRTEDATEKLEKATAIYMKTQRGKEEESAQAGRQYMPLMAFVDEEHSREMSTCSGDFDNDPLFEATPDSCAAACDDDRKCDGFSYYDVDNVGSICFLVRKFKKISHYTECYEEEEKDGGKGKFLQFRKPAISKSSSSKFDAIVSAIGAHGKSAKKNHTTHVVPREITNSQLTRSLLAGKRAFGCRCDEEKYLGICMKKCAILTEGEFAMRSGVNTCCRSEPCNKAGNSKTEGFGLCKGFGVNGDGECASPATEDRAGTGECAEDPPEQVEPEDLELPEPAGEGVNPTATQMVVELMKDEVLDGKLGVGVDAGEKIEGDNPGLVMCFAKASKYSGTKPKIKVEKLDRCYKEE